MKHIAYIFKKLYENQQISILFFSLMFFIADFMNGIGGYNIDLNAIMLMYGVVAGRDVLNYHTDSKFNTKEGEQPKKNY